MIGTIRRHQNWLWLIIIAAVIVSFVVYFTPESGRGGGGGQAPTFGSINGHPISRDQIAAAYQETRLRYLFTYGSWPGNERTGFDIESESLNRLLLIEKLKEMKIEGSDDATAQWIAEAFRDRKQLTFRKDAYDRFVKETLPKNGVDEADFQRFARHEVGIQELIRITGLSGRMIPPHEAEELYRQENEPMATEAIFFSASNHLAKVPVTPAALSQFYTNRQAMYRLPERAQVTYVRFASSNYFAQADKQLAAMTNLSMMLDREYATRGADTFKDATGKVMSPEAAKDKLKQDVRGESALLAARQAAASFAEELSQRAEKQPKNAALLEALAKEKGFTAKVSAPFSQNEGPKELSVPDNFTRVAFALTAEEPIAIEPLVAEDAVYVIALNARIPSELPPLESIRARLTEDYRKSRSLELARDEGNAAYAKLTNSIAKGKKFAEAAAEAKLTVVKIPPFSRSTRSIPEVEGHAEISDLKNLAEILAPGKVSDFTPTRDGGFILHLIERLPVDETKRKQDWTEFMANLRQSRQIEAFGDWFRREHEHSHVVGPTARRAAN